MIAGPIVIKLPLRRAALAAAAIALCSGATAYTPGAASGGIILSNADSGRTFVASPGDTLRVRLSAVQDQGTTWVWSAPVSSDPGVLQRVRFHTSPGGASGARFDVQADGTATLAAEARCTVTTPGAVCPEMVRTWQVTVDVAG